MFLVALDLWAIVNNAGIAAFAEIEWCPVAVYEKVINVNALGPVRMTKAFLPLLRESCGRVVIVASLSGKSSSTTFSINFPLFKKSPNFLLNWFKKIRLKL